MLALVQVHIYKYRDDNYYIPPFNGKDQSIVVHH